jgi:3-methylcrotonyl-CoA carboxylase beta subunit
MSPRLPSQIRTSSPEFKENAAHHEALAEDLRRQIERVRQGGSPRSVEKHHARGKLLPRERVDRCSTPARPFWRSQPLAAHGIYDDAAPRRHDHRRRPGAGREVHDRRNDATVKGGTYYPMTVKKHLRAQEIAAENRLPCVYLVDSGGANLPNQDEVFPDRDHFGRIFYNQANMSAEGIPQIASSWAPAPRAAPMCRPCRDESIIVASRARSSSAARRW